MPAFLCRVHQSHILFHLQSNSRAITTTGKELAHLKEDRLSDDNLANSHWHQRRDLVEGGIRCLVQ